MGKKKDFEGKSQTSKTYTKDWVFRKNRHTKGPNYSGGAWMTRQQARQAHENERESKQYNQSIRNAQSAPPIPASATPTTVPILGGKPQKPSVSGGKKPKIDPGLTPEPEPGSVPVGVIPGGKGPKVPLPMGPDEPIGQEPQYNPKKPQSTIPNPPTWWINAAIKNPTDPNQQFANVANALLPTLAPEDQRTLATYLATNFKDVYGGYAKTNFGPAPTEITPDLRQQYLSPQRAQMALSLLNKMKAASGVQNMGEGYRFLRNAVSLINQFTNPSGVMGRENYSQFTNAVSSLVGQAEGNKDLAAYANLAQLFNLPKFTAGPIVNNTPNSKLFS